MENTLCNKILSSILALNIFLTACGAKVDNKNDEKLNSSTTTNDDLGYSHVSNTTTTTNPNDIIEPLSISINSDFLNQNFVINNEDLEKFKEYVRNIAVNYPYEKYYSKFKNEIKEYKPSNKEIIIVDNKINKEKLYNYILKNNDNYLKKYGSSNYKDTSDSFVKNVCDILAERIQYYLENYKLDLNLLEEKLQNLCIFNYKSYAKGLYKQKNNILAVNANDCTYEIICHEIDHLVQSASANELEQNEYEYRNGYCYKKTPDGINPYNWTWFIEGCAESMATKDNVEATVYNSELKMLEAMKFITFNVNNDLEESLYQSDVNKLYDYFGAYREEEKDEINKMFYILTVINNNNPGSEGDEFYKKIKNEEGISLAYTNYESTLFGYVALTESKIFYTNLINKIENKEVKLNDIFNIISLFEMELSRQTWYQSNSVVLIEFLEEYANIQNELFNYIGKSMNESSESIKLAFNNYYSSINETNFNIDIPWLPINLNNYYNYFFKTRASDKVSKTIVDTFNSSNSQKMSKR